MRVGTISTILVFALLFGGCRKKVVLPLEGLLPSPGEDAYASFTPEDCPAVCNFIPEAGTCIGEILVTCVGVDEPCDNPCVDEQGNCVEECRDASGECLPECFDSAGLCVLPCILEMGQCVDCAVDAEICVFDDVLGLAGCYPIDFQNPDCVPSCAEKACGSDGCGGSCGFCPEGSVCDGETCQTFGEPCGSVEPKGKCIDDVLTSCINGGLSYLDCAEVDRVCGLNSSTGIYDCLFP